MERAEAPKCVTAAIPFKNVPHVTSTVGSATMMLQKMPPNTTVSWLYPYVLRKMAPRSLYRKHHNRTVARDLVSCTPLAKAELLAPTV